MKHNKTEIKALKLRIETLENEKNDEFCMVNQTARREVDRALDQAWRDLRAAT